VLRRPCRRQHNSMPEPSMVMVDTQVSKGGRAGRYFHQSHAKYLEFKPWKVIYVVSHRPFSRPDSVFWAVWLSPLADLAPVS